MARFLLAKDWELLKDNRFILGTIVAKGFVTYFVTYNGQIMTDLSVCKRFLLGNL